MTRPFDLVVFDWDGTLMDSAAQIITCLQAAAADIGLEPPTAAAARNIIGLGLVEACTALFPDQDIVAYQRLAAAYRRRFLGAPEPPRLFEGAFEVVTGLRQAGYLVAVATGKSRAGLRTAFEQTGLGELMHASRCADETASKPDPRMLREIMAELNVSPARTVMVGDTEYDLAMAHYAGAAAVGVSYGAHDLARLRAYQPLACVDSLGELMEHLALEAPLNFTEDVS